VYVAGSYPLKAYLPLALAWTVGSAAAGALADHRIGRWTPDAGTVVSALTMVVGLLLMRALDDIRDHEYDRRLNPDRPLARGAVSARDLRVMIAVGAVLVLALNAWRWPVLCVVAGQLGYACLVIWVDRRWGWPAERATVTAFFVNLPVQLLINAFLYAGVLYSAGLAPSWPGTVGIAVATLAFLHLEFARKTTRRPRPGETTYVTVLGTAGTAALAVACAVGAVALMVVVAWQTVVLIVLLAFPVVAAVRFRRLERWPYRPAALFLLAFHCGLALVGVAS
jgi:hypothetical protein